MNGMGSDRGFETHNIMAVSAIHWVLLSILILHRHGPRCDKVGHVVGQLRPPYDILPGEKDIKIMRQIRKDIISLKQIVSCVFPNPMIHIG